MILSNTFTSIPVPLSWFGVVCGLELLIQKGEWETTPAKPPNRGKLIYARSSNKPNTAALFFNWAT